MGFSSVNSGSCCSSLGWKSSSFNSSNGVLVGPTNHRITSTRVNVVRASASSSSSEPLLVRAAKGLPVNRPPAWMMRQAGEQAGHETTDLIVEISLQPWEAFHPDGVDGKAAILGFVGAPWTIATYIVEGGTTRTYTNIKSMCHTAPHVLRALLSHLTEAIAEYVVFQVKSGADCVQIFDSWGGQLPPNMWELWSKPYINEWLTEKMKDTGGVMSLVRLGRVIMRCWRRRRLGNDISIQGNVDPAYLFSPLPALEDEIHRVVKCAGPRGHILNLGHGVLVGTPEEAVARFFDVARSFNFDSVEEKSKVVT
ncbi:uroporphyrinogen decarboxylase 1, chloroplastic [Tanacetum coccineum]